MVRLGGFIYDLLSFAMDSAVSYVAKKLQDLARTVSGDKINKAVKFIEIIKTTR